MATKFREGSAGEKEAKAYKIFLVVAAVITILLLSLQWFIPSVYRDAYKQTSTLGHIVGALLVVASWVSLYKGTKAGEEGSYGWCIAWGVMAAAGMLLAAIDGL